MRIEDIEDYILKNFDDVNPLDSWGEKSFFLNPGQQLKRGTYFATLKAKDGENDKASFLDRDNVFRLNMGLTKDCYLSLFSHLPERPAKGCCIKGDYDFHKLNTILPHPIYAWMGWVCVLNPDSKTFEHCKNLLDNAYNKAQQITTKKLSSRIFVNDHFL
jgi:hypothetical protein